MRVMTTRMKKVLPKRVMALLEKIGALCNDRGYRAFIVGGIVRDLLLGVKTLDLDIVVEGDAIEVAAILSRELGGSLKVHKGFGTATVVTKDKLRVDFATARKERYAKPAALPSVEFGSLDDDLSRRDFTINAMAVSINEKDFGRLVDLCGGRTDIKRGRICAMHDGSFIDDPTRIFRAIRFAERLGFTIERRTDTLMRKAMDKGMIEKLSPQRIKKEVALLLKEVRKETL